MELGMTLQPSNPASMSASIQNPLYIKQFPGEVLIRNFDPFVQES